MTLWADDIAVKYQYCNNTPPPPFSSHYLQALEYAKTIVKPSMQPPAKQRQQGHWKEYQEQTPHPKGLDSVPPGTLTALLRRHEEEKKAAAQRVHAVSS